MRRSSRAGTARWPACSSRSTSRPLGYEQADDRPVKEQMSYVSGPNFHGERGRAGLARYRRELTAQLWREWAPGRRFPAEDFDRAALSFDNPDFVDVVIHSYRHRYGLAPGDPVYGEIERQLAAQPQVSVPTIVLDPTEDPMVMPQSVQAHRERFTRLIDHRLVSSGHDMPHDSPDAVVKAVLDLHELPE